MNITKAISHFEFKLDKVWKKTKQDVDAFNAILDYKELVESKAMNENEALAKLWVEKMIILSRTKSYDGQRCIQAIDETLNKSLYELIMILKEEIPLMRFTALMSSKIPISDADSYNITKVKARSKELAEKYETELTEALRHEVSEDKIIKFVESQITRIIHQVDK